MNAAIDNELAGRQQPAWILTGWDTWEPNPMYCGPKVRHPEDDHDEDDQTPVGNDKPEIATMTKKQIIDELAALLAPEDDDVSF